RLPAGAHAFVFTSHHIVCDGWSVNVILREFADAYRAYAAQRMPQLPAPLSFCAYAARERARDPREAAATERFWSEQFATLPPPLELPTDRPRPATRSFAGATESATIERELYLRVKQAGARRGATLFVTLLAAFQTLLGRLADASDVSVGVPIAGQSQLEDEILVGHCVRFLPIRTRWDEATSVAELLARVKRSLLDASEHQNYTLGTLVRKLGIARELNRLPLAEIQFNLERLADDLAGDGLQLTVEPNPKAFVNFDLFLNVIESSDGLRLDCDYRTDLFDAATVARRLAEYRRVLEEFVREPEAPLRTLSYLSDEERALIDAVNATARDFPRAQTVHGLFERSAERAPEASAIEDAAGTHSYGELERAANRLANHLRATVAAGARVGVLVERGAPMVAALLAVLKCGAAYVPLDPSHPGARLRRILAEAQIAALVTDREEARALLPVGAALVNLVHDAATIASTSSERPRADAGADTLAYVIFTSGSTGAPKGVEIAHRSVSNLIAAIAERPGFGPTDVMLSLTTIAFDIAALELFVPLAVGGRVALATSEEVRDGFALLTALERSKATVVQATPSMWRLALEAGFRGRPGLRLLAGGEALPPELALRLLEGGAELWNMYGPTETTIWSSCARIESPEKIGVGWPFANTTFHVRDRAGEPVGIGVPGELWIGGAGLARGYFGRPELTAERFVPNPFGPGRLYRTGDIARFGADGDLQIAGRTDQQVKLRGFRIELGEIEALLGEAGLEAVIVLRADAGPAPQLVAYYLERSAGGRAAAELRAFVAERLPEYMVPSLWIPLAAFPLNPNGKIDRAALPKAEVPLAAAASSYGAAQTATERALAQIWAEVLEREAVGRDEDFFALGADSIQLFKITARAVREGLPLTAKLVLRRRTIAEIAAHLDDGAASASNGHGPSGRANVMPLVRPNPKARELEHFGSKLGA
ncbi:MAG: non-ribosomal peptide synthetase, partial [Vulcanimicrobiaceae bacterium]